MNTEPNTEVTETFTIDDISTAFYMSRDKIFDVDLKYWRTRFVNFREYWEYRQQMIELVKQQDANK